MFNRAQRRELMSRYSKEDLIKLLEESERKNSALTLQMLEIEKITAQKTKDSLSIVFKVMRTVLKQTLLELAMLDEEEISYIADQYLSSLSKEMDSQIQKGSATTKN
jgi:hypothetical protein